MQSILKLRLAVLLLIALNCVLLCTAQGGNGGWGGDSGAPGAPGGGSGGGAPGAPGGGSNGGAPGAPGSPGHSHHDHAYSAAANFGFTHLQWLLALMPFTLLLKYV
ncbi:POU domain, class 4, transcription factor 1-like isoform X1 [Anastrepha obliqua]|uniref:POU domain, class 4, transcription factor 1-like isoform X1 n=1 Tax=Anastrepha obliqua TaxID=95512 RepID=UPI002409F58D|nr:POU domain, class 4, transcription factor 1-like isoform X1 [Anastrepha obliqua]